MFILVAARSINLVIFATVYFTLSRNKQLIACEW